MRLGCSLAAEPSQSRPLRPDVPACMERTRRVMADAAEQSDARCGSFGQVGLQETLTPGETQTADFAVESLKRSLPQFSRPGSVFSPVLRRCPTVSFFLTWLIRFLFFQIPGTRFIAGMLGLIIAIDVFLYLGMALGLYRMARRLRIPGAFLAWVPIVQVYVVGAVADSAGSSFRYRVLLCSLTAAGVALVACASAFPDASAAFGWSAFGAIIVLIVFYCKALYRVYALYSRSPAALLTLSIVFFFLGPIFVFALRNRSPEPVTARRRLR